MPEQEEEAAFVVDPASGTLTAHVDLGFRVERQFEKACDDLLLSEPAELVVNLEVARYICSSCLGMLFLLHERGKLRGKVVRVRVDKSTAPICQLMGLNKFMKLEVVE